MKIHYLFVGLPDHHNFSGVSSYRKTILELLKIFSNYEIHFYFLDDDYYKLYFDKTFLDELNINYTIGTFNYSEYVNFCIKNNKNKETYDINMMTRSNPDKKKRAGYIQYYKVYKIFKLIKDYNEGDIVVRGRTDYIPIFNDSNLADINKPEKGWSNSPDVKIDYNVDLSKYDFKKLYTIGLHYTLHPYNYIWDGYFISNYDNIKIVAECGIKYDAKFYVKNWPWTRRDYYGGLPGEAQMLIHLLKENVEIDTLGNKTSLYRINN